MRCRSSCTGRVELEVRATPGHTPESISVVVYEHAGDEVPYVVLTGDTLFIADVGRPDLLSSAGRSGDELARLLYHSVYEQLLTLPDATRVYPAHGAGSACGKSLSTETVSTIGEQRRTNYALANLTEEDFVAAVTDGRTAPPPYFLFDAQRNRERRKLLDDAPPRWLSLDEVTAVRAGGGVVLDTCTPADFAAGHLRGSVNVSLTGRFSEFAGGVVDPDQLIALVCEPGHEVEAKVRLARIGFDAVVGALEDPVRTFTEHPHEVVQSSRLTADDLAGRRTTVPELVVVDVRGTGERALGAIPDSIHVPLPELTRRIGELDGSRPTVVYCAGGNRSSTAASVLAASGFADVSDLLGGYGAWAATTSA